ncbi:hypothetical protein PILCRDRAFT_814064 [Piloderma croceum F 1598]|uniref:Uncharacterized protein n=1 Tax=Piloderma croceum (strain F 1598) TaxID=765440 RepID=A0A0C3GBY0_PILCF|nr:hypothetical protein PILCRDRAFT_814064 [Piloderma croceum F 1598]
MPSISSIFKSAAKTVFGCHAFQSKIFMSDHSESDLFLPLSGAEDLGACAGGQNCCGECLNDTTSTTDTTPLSSFDCEFTSEGRRASSRTRAYK